MKRTYSSITVTATIILFLIGGYSHFWGNPERTDLFIGFGILTAILCFFALNMDVKRAKKKEKFPNTKR
jgi:hypothetical protein